MPINNYVNPKPSSEFMTLSHSHLNEDSIKLHTRSRGMFQLAINFKRYILWWQWELTICLPLCSLILRQTQQCTSYSTNKAQITSALLQNAHRLCTWETFCKPIWKSFWKMSISEDVAICLHTFLKQRKRWKATIYTWWIKQGKCQNLTCLAMCVSVNP